jgi:hypothetical protein
MLRNRHQPLRQIAIRFRRTAGRIDGERRNSRDGKQQTAYPTEPSVWIAGRNATIRTPSADGATLI